MTPDGIVRLVTDALGRPGRASEYREWAAALERYDDADGWAALSMHRRTSPHPPQLVDVLRCAVVLGNDRAMRAAAENLRIEQQTGRAHDPSDPERHGKPLVPMPPSVREAARQYAARQNARDTALDVDREALEHARAELAARQPVPTPDEVTT
jgi:type II secretory pathway component HofQ